MGQTYEFFGSYYGGNNGESFTGTPDADDVLEATFEGESSGAGLVTDFIEHANGSFTATYRTTQNNSVDSVTISGIENVNIHTTNTYTYQGNEIHQKSTAATAPTGCRRNSAQPPRR
jgi:hypothetical protein